MHHFDDEIEYYVNIDGWAGQMVAVDVLGKKEAFLGVDGVIDGLFKL